MGFETTSQEEPCKPFFTVVVSTYNGENYLERLYRSLEFQTFKNWKLFVFDDASTDQTPLVLERLKKKDPDRVDYFRSEEKLRIGPAKQKAHELSPDCEYAVNMDHDDYYFVPYAFQLLYEMIERENHPDCIRFGYVVREADGASTVRYDTSDANQPWTRVVKRSIRQEFGVTDMDDMFNYVSVMDQCTTDKSLLIPLYCWDHHENKSVCATSTEFYACFLDETHRLFNYKPKTLRGEITKRSRLTEMLDSFMVPTSVFNTRITDDSDKELLSYLQTETNNKDVHLAYCSEHNPSKKQYEQLVLSICSVLRYRKDSTRLHFHLFLYGYSDTYLDQLRTIVQGKADLSICLLNDEVMKTLRSYINPKNSFHVTSGMTFCRLFMHKLDPSLEKVLYLDSDVIVKSDLLSFYNLNMNGYCVAGVRDSGALDRGRTYINAGVLLMNFKEWKVEMVESNLNLAMRNAKKMKYYDQDVINTAFAGKKILLPPEYNVQVPSILNPANLINYNINHKSHFKSHEEIFKKAFVLHYCGEIGTSFIINPSKRDETLPMAMQHYQKLVQTTFSK